MALLKKLGQIFCPVLLGASMEECASIVVLFPNLHSMKHAILLSFLYFVYVCFIIDSFFFKYVNIRLIQMLPRASIGSLQNVIHMLIGIGFVEMFIFRSYFTYISTKYAKEEINWFKIASNITDASNPKLFLILRTLLLQLYFSLLCVITVAPIMKLCFEGWSILDWSACIMWFLFNLILLRYSIVDVALLYVMMCGLYVYVNERMNSFTSNFDDFQVTQSPLSIRSILAQYKRLIKLIIDVDQLVMFITFVNDLLVIPLLGVVIVTALTNTENSMQSLIKWAVAVSGLCYGVRGIVITIVLAKIESNSRVLYKQLASYSARSTVKGIIWQTQIIGIMEDLSCSRNHLTIRELSGAISQIDSMENIISIAQFVMLVLGFSTQFAP